MHTLHISEFSLPGSEHTSAEKLRESRRKTFPYSDLTLFLSNMLPALLFVVTLTSCVAQTPETTTGITPTSTTTSTGITPTSTTTSTVGPPTSTTTTTNVTHPPLEIFAVLEMTVRSSQALNATDLDAVLDKLADLIVAKNNSAIFTLSVKKVKF
ncbi:integumentary mucin C.1-like isoform X1 [Nerophis ophidion]|uniref:integumentary mucin C.1-like isoform X1 n=1 Tax=Nerophis ophidion TaxID=159077 RepID=UPI002ADF723C|nr:integumentary mucin C.1-like isoform X1 [Nerophis ophidion]